MSDMLSRSSSNRVIAGVCGGLAEYFRVDPILVRLVWLALVLAGGAGIIMYIIALIIMPEKQEVNSLQTVQRKNRNEDTVVEGDASVTEEQSSSEEKEEQRNEQKKMKYENDEKRQKTLGFILVGLGCYFLLAKFIPRIQFHNWWPVLLIIIGFFIVFKNKGDN